SRSLPLVAALSSMWTTTEVEVPVQPARIEFGSGGSEKVKTTLSPCSGRPAVPPDLLVVWISEAVGATPSTVTVYSLSVLEFFAASVSVSEYLKVPSACLLSTLSDAERRL